MGVLDRNKGIYVLRDTKAYLAAIITQEVAEQVPMSEKEGVTDPQTYRLRQAMLDIRLNDEVRGLVPFMYDTLHTLEGALRSDPREVAKEYHYHYNSSTEREG